MEKNKPLSLLLRLVRAIYLVYFEAKSHLWYYLLCRFGIHSLYICQWERINDKMTPVVVACRYCPQIRNFKGEQ